MAELIAIILNVIAPIFIVFGIATLIGRRFRPDPRSLSTILVYMFSPALVFTGIARSDLSGGALLQVVGTILLLTMAVFIIGTLMSRWLKLNQKLQSAFLLSIILMNMGNYGIPLNRFAFGESGEQQAIIFFAFGSLISGVLGIYLASRGSFPVGQALQNILKVPITWGALLGLAANLSGFALPLPLERVIDLLAQAAIPGMMTLLGIQLARLQSLRGNWRVIWLATGTRLILAPLIVLPIALLLGLTETTLKVAIIQMSMPTAVMASALATQFGSDAETTSTIIMISTLMSIISLTILIWLVSNLL